MDTGTSLIVLAIILAVAVVILAFSTYKLRRHIDRLAKGQFEGWKESEIQAVRLQEKEIAQREARVQLIEWVIEKEASIRQDAITRSQATIVGRVTEHIAPYSPAFPFNPKDVRFIGSPVDVIVFDGCDDGDVREMIFMEIKTGASSLSAKQRQIRDAVQSGRVRWLEFRVDNPAGKLSPH